MGLQFHHIPDGVFESGGKGTNTIEAKAVAKQSWSMPINIPNSHSALQHFLFPNVKLFRTSSSYFAV